MEHAPRLATPAFALLFFSLPQFTHCKLCDVFAACC